MKISRSIQIQSALFVIAILYSLFMASRMPDVTPTHWNAAGQIDGYGSKWSILLIMPGVMLFVGLITAAIPKLSPEKFKIEPFEATYSRMMVIMDALMLTLHVVIVQSSLGAKWDLSKVMMGVLFLSFIFIGNLMGKIQRNFYMGVRTPWTLSDERVWQGTHRFAGKVMVFGSILGLLLVVVGLPFWLTFAYFMVMCLSPVLQSYVLYQQLHKSS